MRTLFLGTGEIGLPALQWLLDHPETGLCGVICQPDKPVGRKLVLTPPATKSLALAHGIPVHQPERLRRAVDLVAGLAPDLILVMAYGQLLPPDILAIPPLGCLNLHASLLPRHRGASPIQAVLLAGESVSGTTLMHMAEGLDTGDVILQETLTLAPDETGGSLHERIAALSPAVLERAWPLLTSGTAPRTPQDPALATHCGKLTRADGVLDWRASAAELGRRIRAFDPWPGTSTTLPDGTLLKVFPPVLASAEASGCPVPGTVLAASPDGLRIATGDGILTLTTVQPAGRRKMSVREFLAGHPLAAGERLGA